MSTWVYQVENFEPAPDEELVCSICQGVFNDPVQCHCQHVFCRGCLSQWLSRSRTCPVCREHSSIRSVRSAPPLVRSLVGKLRVKCPRCHCDPMIIGEAEKHRCPEALVRCRACRELVKRANILDHRRRLCSQRTEMCPHCRLRIPPRPVETAASAFPVKLPKHHCIRALKRKLKEQSEDIKEKAKRIKELEDRVRQLEEEVSAHNRDSSESSDDEILSTPTLSSDDEEFVINIEGIDGSSSSEQEEEEVHSDREWLGALLEAARLRQASESREVPRSQREEESDESRDGVPPAQAPKRRRPGNPSASSETPGEPIAHSSNTTQSQFRPSTYVFNRTMSMLEQYNQESDDEWFPPRPLDERNSDSSSISSPSHYEDSFDQEDEDPHWVTRLLEGSSDEDPDWSPL